MNTQEHDDVRDLLTLAAAGALSAEEQKQVEKHLRDCVECSAEFAAWGRLTAALEEMPTPQAPMGLVERTRRQLEKQAELRVERRHQRWLFALLILFAWAGTLVTWPAFEFLGSRVAGHVDLSWTHLGLTGGWIVFLFVGWVTGALAAGLLGRKRLEAQVTV